MAGTVKWTVRLEAVGADGKRSEAYELVTIVRDADQRDGSDFGLKLAEGKAVLERLQGRIAQDQVDRAVMKHRSCAGCGARRSIHDYQSRREATPQRQGLKRGAATSTTPNGIVNLRERVAERGVGVL